MSKFAKLEEKMMPLVMKIANNRELSAIRDAMYILMPFLIVGSFFLLFSALPIPGYNDFMTNAFGDGWALYLTKITDATFGLMAVIIVFATSYCYSKVLGVNTLAAPVTSIMFFFIVTPFVDGSIPLEWLGTKGMFLGMIIALIITKLFVTLFNKNLFPKMPDSVPPGVMASFQSVVPVIIIALLAMIINIAMLITPFASLHELIYTFLATPLLMVGNSLPGIVISEMLSEFLWLFGIHGNNVVASVMQPILLQLSAENLAMVQQGLEPVNIINQQFKDTYLLIGGSGSTLPLLVVILMTSKSKHLRMIAAMAIIPGIFNINEPVIFGLPIVLNPILAIPFMLVPAVFAIISYGAMSIGLVAITNGLVIPWTTPVFINGLLVSGPSGAVLQLLLFILGMAIYYPFVRIIDRQLTSEEGEEV